MTNVPEAVFVQLMSEQAKIVCIDFSASAGKLLVTIEAEAVDTSISMNKQQPLKTEPLVELAQHSTDMYRQPSSRHTRSHAIYRERADAETPAESGAPVVESDNEGQP